MTKNKPSSEKRFIVRKYVMARSAEQAIKKEKKITVSDVWIDTDWLEDNSQSSIKGF